MNIYDACEQAYKNGYNAGRDSMINQCVMCGTEIPVEEGHVCLKCASGKYPAPLVRLAESPNPNTELSFGANDGQYDFRVYCRRAKPLNRFQIWMYKVCFGIRARNVGDFK